MKTYSNNKVLLGDIAELRSGVGFPKVFQGKRNGDFPFAKVGDISEVVRSGNNCIKDAPNWICEEDLPAIKGKPFPSGTIAFAKIGEAIRQNFRVLSSCPMLFDNNVMGIIPNQNIVYTQYLFYFLRTIDLYSLAEKTTVPSIRKSTLERLFLPLPPLEEQKRIAVILDKADAIRRKRKQAIALTEELLRSTFLDMFGDPVINPKGWREVFLGDISKVQGGLQVTSKRKNHPLAIPYLRVANVYRDRLVLDEIKTIRVTQQEAERTYLQIGDLLIVEGHGNSTEIGRSSVWDGSIPNCTHQNHLIRVRIDRKKADPMYISTFLNSPGGRRQLNKFGKTTSGLNTISTSNVKATKILLPPLSEQENFLKVRKVIISSLNNHQRYFSDLDNLFNSLLQKAFRVEL